MILDAKLLFSDAQALSATAVSTNVIDLGTDRDIGAGEPMGVLITVDVAATTNDNDETYQFDLQTDSDEAFGTAVVIARRLIARASLVAGSAWVIPLPFDNQQYLRMNYTLGGTTPAITVTTVLIPLKFIDKSAQYPDAITIS